MLSAHKELYQLPLPWEKLNHTNILVTGGNGLIASNLIDELMLASKNLNLNINLYALCRNADRATKRFSKYLDAENFHLIIQDVCDPLELEIDFQLIIHAASSAHPQAFNSVPVDVMCANFLGTLNLLNYSLKHQGVRFIFVSSSEVYGENKEGIPLFREDMSGSVDYTKFRSCYPESKRALKGTKIGSGAIIGGAACIANKKIPSNVSAVGNPIKIVRENVFFLRDSVHKWTKDITKKYVRVDTDNYLYFASPDMVDMDDMDSALKAESGHGRADGEKQLVERLLVNNTSKNRFFLPLDT